MSKRTRLLEFCVKVERWKEIKDDQSEDTYGMDEWTTEFLMEVPVSATHDQIEELAKAEVKKMDSFLFYEDEVVCVDYEEPSYGPYPDYPGYGIEYLPKVSSPPED